MKLFEPYFAILDGYDFATPQDRENALWAALWASQACLARSKNNPTYRPPMVVIEGPAGVGKSHLAAALSAFTGQEGFFDQLTESYLNLIAYEQRAIACFDNVAALGKEIDEVLAKFITAQSWKYRILRSEVGQIEDLRCLTILTATALELSPELERRTLRIRLLGRDGVEAGARVEDGRFSLASVLMGRMGQAVEVVVFSMAEILDAAQSESMCFHFDWPKGADKKPWAEYSPRERSWFGKLMQIWFSGRTYRAASGEVYVFQRCRKMAGTCYEMKKATKKAV